MSRQIVSVHKNVYIINQKINYFTLYFVIFQKYVIYLILHRILSVDNKFFFLILFKTQ